MNEFLSEHWVLVYGLCMYAWGGLSMYLTLKVNKKLKEKSE